MVLYRNSAEQGTAGDVLFENHATVSSGDFLIAEQLLRRVFEHLFQVLQNLFWIDTFWWCQDHFTPVNASVQLSALFVRDMFGR